MTIAKKYLEDLIAQHLDNDANSGITASDSKLLHELRIHKAIELEVQRSSLKLSAEQKEQLQKRFGSSLKLSDQDIANEKPYGDPILQQIFRPLIIKASSCAKKLGILETDIGEIGTLPIGTPNAMAIAVPNSNEHVVVFQRGLPLFLNRLCKIALEVDYNIPPESYKHLRLDQDGWQERYRVAAKQSIATHELTLDNLILLMVATIVGNDPSLAPPHHVPLSVSLSRVTLLHYMELFIVGHELAHIGSNHLNADRRTVVEDFDGNKHEMYTTEVEDEITADILGWTISDTCVLDESNSKFDQTYSYYGIAAPGFFFSCISCLERFMSLVSEDWCAGETHPPTELRKQIRHEFLLEVDNRPGYVTAEKLDIVLDEMYLAGASKFQSFCRELPN